MAGQAGLGEGKARAHELDGFEAAVDEQEAAPEIGRGDAGGSTAGEEVEDEVAGAGVDAHDALEELERLLRRVAGLLAAVGGDDGDPPDVGGNFAAGGLLGADEAGRHVGDPIDGVEVEGVSLGRVRVPEDVVVLGGPAIARLAAIVVGPDDLIAEAGAAEYLVEQNFGVVGFAWVEMQEERAGGFEQPMGFNESRTEEGEVVVEVVGVGGRGQRLDLITSTAEAIACAANATARSDARALLGDSGVERWIDVDEIDRGRGKLLEDGKVIAEVNVAGEMSYSFGRAIRLRHRASLRGKESDQFPHFARRA